MVRQSYRPLVDTQEQQRQRHHRTQIVDIKPCVREERLGISRRPASTGRTRLFGDASGQEDERLEMSQRSISNGRGGIPPPRSNRVTATRSNRRDALRGSPAGMYERGLDHMAKKKAKREQILKEMMQECTFTPKTSYSTSTSASRTTTTNASSETKGILDDVYERLYRHSSVAGSPLQTASPRTARSRAGSSILPSGMSRGGSACSSRIEELYQEGKTKLRSRLTEQQERTMREKRREQQQILECTFRPQTRWAVRVDPSKRDLGRIGISPRSPTRKNRTTPPQEILVSSPSDIRHWTPQRRHRTHTSVDYTMVSPLHEPSMYEDTTTDRSIDDSTLLPRMQCIGSTVGTSTAASVSQVTDAATDYGSI